jgi:hypothetical protein
MSWRKRAAQTFCAIIASHSLFGGNNKRLAELEWKVEELEQRLANSPLIY